MREDKLKQENIDQGKRMNELRADHERSMYEMSNTNQDKIDQLRVSHEADKRRCLLKLKEELQFKNEKIKEA